VHALSRTDIELLTVVVFWGLNFTVAKFALAEMTPLAFNGLRVTLAATVLMTIHLLRRGPAPTSLRDRAWMMGLGLIGHTAYQLFFIEGLARTTATHSALIYGVTPVLVALLSLLFGHEQIVPATWGGALLAFGGVYLIMAGIPPAVGPAASWTGDLLILAAAACWSLYTVLSRSLLSRHSPLKLTAVTMAWGSLFLIPLSARAMITEPWSSIGPGAWAATGYGIFFPLVFAYLLWYRAIRSVGSVRTAVYSNLVPVTGALAGWLILGERLYPALGVGAAAIFLGILLTRRQGAVPTAGEGAG
jgi:drug/metabolite transporter (DMT)-like permease